MTQILFQKVLELFALIVAGVLLCRFGIVRPETAHALSTLELYIFCPSLLFCSFSTLTVRQLGEKATILLWGCALFAVTYAVSIAISKKLSGDRFIRSVYTYTLAVPNVGFFGCAIAEAAFGEEVLLNLMIMTLPLTFYTYTEGYRALCDREKISLKGLLNPNMIGLMAGAFFGLTGLCVPVVLEETAIQAKSCMAPVSMLLTGMVISQYTPKKPLCSVKRYIVSLLRLVVFPLCVLLPMRLAGVDASVRTAAALVYTMPAGCSTIMFPQLTGKDCTPGAGLLLITSVLGMITIPILLSLFA